MTLDLTSPPPQVIGPGVSHVTEAPAVAAAHLHKIGKSRGREQGHSARRLSSGEGCLARRGPSAQIATTYENPQSVEYHNELVFVAEELGDTPLCLPQSGRDLIVGGKSRLNATCPSA